MGEGNKIENKQGDPEKRIFTIDVGNIDEEDIEEYIQMVVEKFKRPLEYPDDYELPDIKLEE